MITLTRLNGRKITINAILIESIEDIPDTLIILTTGKKLVVLETVHDVVRLVQNYMESVGSMRVAIKSQDLEGS